MRVFAVIAATACAMSLGCGGSDTAPSGATGTMRMMLKDSPFTDAKSLLVTFSEVDAHRSGTSDSSWAKVPFTGGATSRTCDLKKLQTAQDVLGTGPLTAGHYTQVRLVVSSATIYFENAASGDACAATIAAPAGRSASVTIPSGEVKLNREFDVSSGATTTMLLDFDGDRSVRETGNGQFMMSPVIGVVSVQ
ncbi:MAG TPA: DUF4382 domain-containing protein [Vicinamibacterales bacterium]